MTRIDFCLIAALYFLSISCATKKSISPGETKNINEGSYFIIVDSLEKIAINAKSWKQVDDFYRKNIAPDKSGELTNQAIFWISHPDLDFIEDAKIGKIEYYLNEADQIPFNINLRLLIPMIDRIKNKWGLQKTAAYAKRIYEKNTLYWQEHFPGQTSYLEKNEKALNDLISFQLKSN